MRAPVLLLVHVLLLLSTVLHVHVGAIGDSLQRRMDPFSFGVGRAIPLVAANKAVTLDSSGWSFGFSTEEGGGPYSSQESCI